MDIRNLMLSSIYKAFIDSWHIWAIIILLFILGGVAQVFIYRFRRNTEKKLRFFFLSKTDPRRYEIESKTDKNICPECGSELVIKYDRFGRFKGCSNPRCRFATKLNLN